MKDLVPDTGTEIIMMSTANGVSDFWKLMEESNGETDIDDEEEESGSDKRRGSELG